MRLHGSSDNASVRRIINLIILNITTGYLEVRCHVEKVMDICMKVQYGSILIRKQFASTLLTWFSHKMGIVTSNVSDLSTLSKRFLFSRF